jgi:hypothetical protein
MEGKIKEIPVWYLQFAFDDGSNASAALVPALKGLRLSLNVSSSTDLIAVYEACTERLFYGSTFALSSYKIFGFGT